MRRLILLAKADARRPAAWLTLAAAAVVAGLLSAAPVDGIPTPALMAMVVGASLAVAVVGDATRRANAADIDSPRVAERAAWPLVGWLLAAGGMGSGVLATHGAFGIMTATGLFALLTRRGLLAADAASMTLVAAFSAGAMGWWADESWPGRMPGIAAGGLLAGVAIAAWGLVGRRSSTAMQMRSTARHLLTAAGMMGAMAGMVGWLFLAAEFAMFDLAASLAWFVALAVPAATLGDGVSHAVVWQRLECVAPRPVGGWPQLAPGRVRDSVQAVFVTAALLGWPPLVVAALAGGDAARSGASLLVVAAVAAAAVVLFVIVSLGGVARALPDTQLAIAIASTCLCAAALRILMSGQALFLLTRPVAGW